MGNTLEEARLEEAGLKAAHSESTTGDYAD